MPEQMPEQMIVTAQPEASALLSQSLSAVVDCFRTIAANSSARASAAGNGPAIARNFSTRACSSALRSSARRMDSNDNCRADGTGTGGTTGVPTRGPGRPVLPALRLTNRRTAS